MVNTIVNGSDVVLFVTTTGAIKNPIAMSTSCKIAITMGIIKTSSKDNGQFESSIGGRFSWSADSEQFYSIDVDPDRQSFDELMTLFLAKTPIVITIAKTTGVMPQVPGTGKVLSGTVLITKLDMDAKDDNAVTYSISMEGISALTYV